MIEMQPFIRQTTTVWIRSKSDVQLLAPYVMSLGYKWASGDDFLEYQPNKHEYFLTFKGREKKITFSANTRQALGALTVDDLPILNYRNV